MKEVVHTDYEKNIIAILPLVAAVAVGWGVGRFVVSEWVMPEPAGAASWEAWLGDDGADATDGLEKKGGRNGRIAVVAQDRTDVARRGAVGEVPRNRRWIAEVKVGPYRQQAVRVDGVNDDGSPRVVSIGMGDARRGFAAAVRNSVRRGVKAPVDERWAKLVDHSSGGGGAGGGESDGLSLGVMAGDVYLSGIPMIDQGPAAYCAVASAARVLQNYRIDITMEDMTDLAGSSETGGTNIRRWEDALRRVANSHGLELRTVHDVTDTDRPIQQLLYDYNHMARDMGYEELYTWDYANAFVLDYKKFSEDREYPVQREVLLSDERACDAFSKNVVERIEEQDPLFWTVRLGDVPEDGVVQGDHSPHMRLIIGYNEDRGEVLYSDSWGEGHELKRMDAQDALSITQGMYYLTD